MSNKIHLFSFVFYDIIISGDNMEDLRVRRTKAAITGAFIDLVLEKGFEYVKVKDICAKAMINRNTFYLHYLDKEDLLQKMVDSIFIDQENSIMNIKKENTYSDFESVKKGFVYVLDSFQKEIEFFRILLLDSSMSGYVDKYVNRLKHAFTKIYGLDYNEFKIELDYIFFGIVGVFKNWIVKDYSSIDELSTKLTNLTLNSLSNFIKK